MIFDSHCHLNDENLYPRIDEVIEAAKKTGVKKFLVVGYDKASSLLHDQELELEKFAKDLKVK